MFFVNTRDAKNVAKLPNNHTELDPPQARSVLMDLYCITWGYDQNISRCFFSNISSFSLSSDR